MIKNVFFDVLPDVWPMLIIISVIISSLRIAYLITKHKRFLLHKELIYFISIIYILCLFHIVTFQDSNYGTFKKAVAVVFDFLCDIGSCTS